MAKKPPAPPKLLKEQTDEFIKLIGSGAFEKNDGEKFQDWVEAAYCAYAKLSALAMNDQARADDLEARYMRIVDSYRDKDYIREVWVPLKEIAIEAVEPGGCDFLGVVAGLIGQLNAGQGQFFTPFEVSRMLAQMQLTDMQPVIEKNGFLTLGEPACGSGGMIIAAADVVQQLGFNPMLTMLVEAWDVSYLAYCMCFLQLTWRGVTAHVVRGNSLSMKTFEEAWTPFIPIFYGMHGRLFEPKQKTIDDAIREAIALERLSTIEQTPEPAVLEQEPPIEAVEMELALPGRLEQLSLF